MKGTKRIESAWMNQYEVEGRRMGHISLKELAVPSTVKVNFLEEEIVPVSFDALGHPVFTEEQYKLYTFKADEFRRLIGANVPVKVQITYEVDNFDIPRESFDTIEGIERSLISLESFNQMLINRKRFNKMKPNEKLAEFWVLGCFCLDQYGQLLAVDKSEKYNIIPCKDVEDYAEFCENNRNFTLTGLNGGFTVPSSGSVCQCCGKEFTIEDVKQNCIQDSGKYYHESCYRNYQRFIEVDRFTRGIMNHVYEMFKYTFDLLPNGSCNRKCCSHIPWFMFHTEHGDIKMGSKNKVIFIEWQENYLPFDITEVFEREDAIKWEKCGKRGIHAAGDRKAIEYLRRVIAKSGS